MAASPLASIVNALKIAGWYLAMALGGCLCAGAFGYYRLKGAAGELSEKEGLLIVTEGTALMMSGILLAGSLYCRVIGNVRESADMKRFMSWRIHLLHLFTLAVVGYDVFLHRSA
jgi:hypothetical protein